MPSTSLRSFRFKKHDHIGALAAEQDTQFLESCFVDTGAYELAQADDDNRVIVVGRTGTGKSALLRMLESKHARQVVRIEPENLALAYVSNSTILNFFADIGVNLDPFFKLLWRHVITVELLNHHFQGRNDQSPPNLLSRLRELFSSDTKEDRERQQAVTYIETWGRSFWKDTEFPCQGNNNQCRASTGSRHRGPCRNRRTWNSVHDFRGIDTDGDRACGNQEEGTRGHQQCPGTRPEQSTKANRRRPRRSA